MYITGPCCKEVWWFAETATNSLTVLARDGAISPALQRGLDLVTPNGKNKAEVMATSETGS